MQREIKFRAQTIGRPVWVYGHYFQQKGVHYIASSVSGRDVLYEIKPETVGQFTGLHDMNKTEIYEEDVVKIGDKKAEIKWKRNSFMATNVFSDWELLGNILAAMEVIGNTTDHPHLLEGEGK